jgi:serine/threonine protein kinase/HEAT repeat protein
MIPSDENIQQPALKQIGHFEIIRQIGQGAMGIVYEASQIGLGRKVALKVLPSPLAQDRTYVKRFRNEASAAARINHPNIATVYDYGELETGPFIAMEYIEGKTLEDILSVKTLSMEQALEISQKLAEALAFAHEHGIIHRDIKSGNVMLDSSGRVVIMDFGLAKIENATLLTLDGTIMGTPAYMAPEQAKSDPDLPVSSSVDIYSLGVLMYEMFTGQLPFKASNHMAVLKKALEEEPVPPAHINSRISKDLQVIILKSMEKNPRDRYVSSQALAEDLRRLRSGEPILAKRRSVWMKAYRKSRKYRAVFAALALAFLIALAWTSFLLNRHSHARSEHQRILKEAQARLDSVQQEREILLEKLSEDPLFRVLESRDPLMRAQAIIALNQKIRESELKGKLEKESFNLTLKALDDPHPLVRRHAAILLGILKDPRASEALLNRIEDEDAQVRKHAVLALGLLQDFRAIPTILRCLKDSDEEVRASAALSLGLLKANAAVDILIRALSDPFPTVRSSAAAALGVLKDSKAIEPLIRRLEDSVEEVRMSAEEALSNFGEEARMPVLLATLKNPLSEPAKIVEVLRKIETERDEFAFQTVLGLLDHADPLVRYHTVLVLGLYENSVAIPFLIKHLDDSDLSVRENIRLALIGLTGQDFGFDEEQWEEWWSKENQK